MNIQIKSTSFELTPAIEEYINRKMSFVKKLLSPDILCEIEIGRSVGSQKTGEIFRAEINIVGPDINQVYVTSEETDLYMAIDGACYEAERSIVHKKNKKDTMLKKGGAIVKNLLKKLDFRNPR